MPTDMALMNYLISAVGFIALMILEDELPDISSRFGFGFGFYFESSNA